MSKQRAKDCCLSEDFYEVEAILAQRSTASGPEYLVKWKNYDHSQNTWEPCSNLNSAQRVISEFEQKQKAERQEDSEEDKLRESPQKRKRLCPATRPSKPTPAKPDSDNSSIYSEEEAKPTHKKRQGKTEDLEILGVRVGRGNEYIWTVRVRGDQKAELSLEQVKQRAPLTLIDYLVSKLRFA